MYALSSTAKENINCRLPTADILVVPLATVFACSQFCGSATVADGRI